MGYKCAMIDCEIETEEQVCEECVEAMRKGAITRDFVDDVRAFDDDLQRLLGRVGTEYSMPSGMLYALLMYHAEEVMKIWREDS